MATSAKCQKHNTPHNVVAVALAVVVAAVFDDVNVVAVVVVVVLLLLLLMHLMAHWHVVAAMRIDWT